MFPSAFTWCVVSKVFKPRRGDPLVEFVIVVWIVGKQWLQWVIGKLVHTRACIWHIKR